MKLVALTLGACRLVPEPVANSVHKLTSCLANAVGSVLLLIKSEVAGIVDLFE